MPGIEAARASSNGRRAVAGRHDDAVRDQRLRRLESAPGSSGASVAIRTPEAGDQSATAPGSGALEDRGVVRAGALRREERALDVPAERRRALRSRRARLAGSTARAGRRSPTTG